LKFFNCSPRLAQKFYVPTRNELLPIIEDLSKQIVDIVLPVDEMIDKVALYISKRFGVNVLHAQNPHVCPGLMNVDAEYDQENDQQDQVAVQLILITYPVDNSYLWDQETVNTLSIKIVDTLIHELAHMHQARSRNFKCLFNEIEDFQTDIEHAQHYLGNRDEIDAYAYNIVDQLVESCEYTDIQQFLKNPTAITLETSFNLWIYMNTFEQNVDHPCIKRLLKKVYKKIINYNH